MLNNKSCLAPESQDHLTLCQKWDLMCTYNAYASFSKNLKSGNGLKLTNHLGNHYLFSMPKITARLMNFWETGPASLTLHVPQVWDHILSCVYIGLNRGIVVCSYTFVILHNTSIFVCVLKFKNT